MPFGFGGMSALFALGSNLNERWDEEEDREPEGLNCYFLSFLSRLFFSLFSEDVKVYCYTYKNC